MAKKIFSLCIFLISSCGIINAQEWSKEDSIWLNNILEGNYELKINEDTKKAIEDGRLIVPSWMKNEEGKPIDLEIIQDLDNAGRPDPSSIHRIDPYSMPPAVFSLYIYHLMQTDSVLNLPLMVLSKEEIARLKEPLSPAERSTYYFNEFEGEVKTRITTDFNHALSMLFSSSYRRKVYNRRNAYIYKEGYKPMEINERERNELRQSIINVRSSSGSSMGVKKRGIDD